MNERVPAPPPSGAAVVPYGTETGSEAPDAALARAQYLRAMRLVPGAVAILAAAAGDERTGLAVTAWNSLSADPPTLLACVNQRASAYAAVRKAGAFSLNVLGADHEETVAIFSAQRGLMGADRFVAGAWRTSALGQPVFIDAVASFVCSLSAVHEEGTHGLFIGAVLEQTVREVSVPALLYVDGRFTRCLD